MVRWRDLARGRPTRRAPPPRRPLTGTTAAGIIGLDPAGRPGERRWPGSDRTLVAFLTGGCVECQPFWSALGDPATAAEAGLPVLFVTPGPGTESRRGIAARAHDGTAVIMSSEAWTTYGVRGAPWFVVVTDGVVETEGHAGTWPQLLDLVGH